MTMFKFGEEVKGYNIPVLNEREVRAAAGIYLILIFASMQRVIYFWDYSLLKYISSIFFFDFVIRVFLSPRFSPSLIIGRLIVRNQTPEYVGAAQKKFAWIIGVLLGGIMFVSLNVLNIHSPITGIICMICFFFLMFESIFGICLGCKLYPYVTRQQPQYCPGEICDPKTKQAIQMTSKSQWIALVVFLGFLIGFIPSMKDHFSKEPELKLGMEKPN